MASTESKNCCHECPDRNAICHAICEKYAEYSARNEARRNEERLLSKIDDVCYEFGSQARKKRKRRKNLH